MNVKVGDHVSVNRDRDLRGRSINRELLYEVFLYVDDHVVMLKPHRGLHHLEVPVSDVISNKE